MIGIDLSGKTALVTGASQGLGEQTARTLHRAGASVIVNYFPTEDNVHGQRAEALVEDLGERIAAVGADVCNARQVAAMFEAATEWFGAVDVVVNNAGILRDRTVKKMAEDEWQAVIDTNLTGVFHVCQAAAERLADGGRIVNMASISAAIGFFGQANYVAAKSGVVGLTKVLSRELARRGITVNAVAPGVVLTEMGKSIPEEVRAEMLKQIPLERFGEPSDISNAILFLCSDLAAYITGQTVHVNGGWWG